MFFIQVLSRPFFYSLNPAFIFILAYRYPSFRFKIVTAAPLIFFIQERGRGGRFYSEVFSQRSLFVFILLQWKYRPPFLRDTPHPLAIRLYIPLPAIRYLYNFSPLLRNGHPILLRIVRILHGGGVSVCLLAFGMI